jgi:hypothetical protein
MQPMVQRRNQQGWRMAVALTAVWVLALLPTLSRAWAFASDAPEIGSYCQASSSPGEQPADGDGRAAGHSLDACLACVLAAHAAPPVDVYPSIVFTTAWSAAALPPPAEGIAPLPLPPGSRGRPRAPPFASA